MYHLINGNVLSILRTLNNGYHVPEYDWLLQNVRQQPRPPGFERRYRKYWRMNAARLGPNFCVAYFQELDKALAAGSPPPPSQVCLSLYQVPANAAGAQRLHFSFATKLCHMVDQDQPIYDSLVAAFFFFARPLVSAAKSPQQNLSGMQSFYARLQQEYTRVLNAHLLGPAISAFRQVLTPGSFSDTKIIDSLIWGFLDLARQQKIRYC